MCEESVKSILLIFHQSLRPNSKNGKYCLQCTGQGQKDGQSYGTVKMHTLESHHQPDSGQWHSREKRGRAEEKREQACGKVKKRTSKGQRQMSKQPYLQMQFCNPLQPFHPPVFFFGLLFLHFYSILFYLILSYFLKSLFNQSKCRFCKIFFSCTKFAVVKH